jgi:hypothetical protein
MDTLLLDVSEWDLVLDAAGNIAVASRPYGLSQDVASAIKLFLGELWYNDTAGVDYFGEILGKTPPIVIFKERLEAAAMTVPGVVSAVCEVSNFENRTVQGQVLFTDDSGNTGTVTL